MACAWSRFARPLRCSTVERTRMASGIAKASTTSVVMPTTSSRIRRASRPRRPGLRHLSKPRLAPALMPRPPRAPPAARRRPGRCAGSAACGRLAELAAQPRQVHVDRAVRAAPGQLPHLAQQVALGHDLAGAAGQREQQLELLAGQLDRPAVDGHLVAAGVDRRPPTVIIGSSSVRPAAQHGPDAGVELDGGEGLDDVVVGADLEQPHHRRPVVAGRRDDDRDVADGPQHRQDVGPVDVRQAEVEQHDVRLLLDGRRQRRHPGADALTTCPWSRSARVRAVRIAASSSTSSTWPWARRYI